VATGATGGIVFYLFVGNEKNPPSEFFFAAGGGSMPVNCEAIWRYRPLKTLLWFSINGVPRLMDSDAFRKSLGRHAKIGRFMSF
jgi:hypothetical protein